MASSIPILRVCVILGAIVLAWVLGGAVARQNYSPVFLTGFILATIAYVVRLHRATWIIGLVLCMTNFHFYTFGFGMTATELVTLLGAACALLFSWVKPAPGSVSPSSALPALQAVRLLLFIWIAYALVHAFHHLLPRPVGMKNIIKSYFGFIAPYAVFLALSARGHTLRLPRSLLGALAVTTALATLLNIGIRSYQTFFGSGGSVGMDRVAAPLFIPIINLVENIYILRTLGPLDILLGVTLLTSPHPYARAPLNRLVAILLIPMGIVGAFVSAGRAALLTGPLYGLVVLFVRRRFALLAVLACAAVLFLAVVNVNADWLNRKLPFQLARSIQMLLVKKDPAIYSAIENSSEWRGGLFQMALDVWRENPKNFWFGRGFLGFETGDYEDAWFGDFEERQHASLMRAATHSLVTDLLVSVGLIGAVVYYLFLFATFAASAGAVRSARLAGESRDLGLILAILSIDYIVVATLGAGLLNITYLWLMIGLAALLVRGHAPGRTPNRSGATAEAAL